MFCSGEPHFESHRPRTLRIVIVLHIFCSKLSFDDYRDVETGALSKTFWLLVLRSRGRGHILSLSSSRWASSLVNPLRNIGFWIKWFENWHRASVEEVLVDFEVKSEIELFLLKKIELKGWMRLKCFLRSMRAEPQQPPIEARECTYWASYHGPTCSKLVVMLDFAVPHEEHKSNGIHLSIPLCEKLRAVNWNPLFLWMNTLLRWPCSVFKIPQHPNSFEHSIEIQLPLLLNRDPTTF